MRTLFMAAGALLLAGLPATAQGPQYAPNLTQPEVRTRSTTNVLATPGYQAVPVVNPYAYAPPAAGYYPSSPYGNYLSGRADVINARANAQVTQQQASLVQQQAYRSMIQSRQDIFNEARYERANTMNSEDLRLQQQSDALRRARNEPPLNEIWSAVALNALYADTKKAHTYGVRGPRVPVDPAIYKDINLTTGVTRGSLGVLKNGPKLRWPSVFADSRFEADRGRLEVEITQALEQARKGPVDPLLLRDMSDCIDRMGVTLKQMVAEVSPGPYIDGKRYLSELDESRRTLRDPDVMNYFDGKYVAQGATVADLIDYMIGKGLSFAPAVSGGQASYTVLYQALLTYDVQMAQSVQSGPR